MSSKHRPTSLILLCLGVLFFSVIHFLGLSAGFRLPDLPLPFPEWYLYLKNGLWGIVGLIVVGGLFSGQKWAPLFARLSGIGISIWYWSDRLLLARSDFAHRAWLIAAMITLLILTWLFRTLKRPAVQDFFWRTYHE